MELAALLQKTINEHNLNQTTFAKSINSTQAQVSDWLANKSKPSYENLRSIAKVYGIDANELLDTKKRIQDKIYRFVCWNRWYSSWI